MKSHKHRTIIIGAGPGGSAAAIYLARFNHEVVLLDAADTVPGRTVWALHLENVLGFTEPKAGPDFLQDIYCQLERFGVHRREELVSGIGRRRNGFLVITSEGNEYLADYVIVAVGVHDIMPDVEKVEEFFGNSIFQCPTCNWYQTKDKKTGIVSNDDAGITTALVFDSMQKGSARYVIPDRPKPHFSAAMMKKAKAAGIEVCECPLLTLNGNRGILESVTITDGTVKDVDILYTKLGVKRHDTFLDAEGLKVERDEDGYLKVNFETLETSVPRLFAVGPCNTGPDQVMVAAGQGISAAMEIHRSILSDKGL